MKQTVSCLPLNPEDRGDVFLRKVGLLPNYAVLQVSYYGILVLTTRAEVRNYLHVPTAFDPNRSPSYCQIGW
jgi:hypothetical protein